MRRCLRLLLVVCLSAIALPEARGQTNTLILPKEALEAYGDGFANLIESQGGYPVQQIYAASEFAGMTEPLMWIVGIGLRPNNPALSLNAIVSFITITMGVFEGPMDELSVRWEDNLQNNKVVLDERNYPLVVPPSNDPTHFTLKLPLSHPFLYDRNRGQLILQFYAGGLNTGGYSYDAHEVSSDRGFYAFRFSDGMSAGGGKMIATEFFYTTISIKIEKIFRVGNSVQIDFSLTGGVPNSVQIEGSQLAAGPYTLEANAVVETISTGNMRALIPMSSKIRFYRVRWN